ncbi:MAG TPA: TIR domain-containing protein [Pyrinomonadaceae bacterium]|jgi:hypothetical protein|nr:TIR domain-containing protein [Pyrinomonadaceae bacterium]
MKYRIAITHAPSDAVVATSIRQALEGVALKCQSLTPLTSDDQEEHASRIIDKSDAMVLVLSAAANGSERIEKQVEKMANRGKPIITFRTDHAPLSKRLEFYLSTPHWLDASSQPLDKHLAELALTTRRLLDERRPRTARKGKTAAILGILSLPISFLSPLAVLLGILELRSIKAGRSLRSSHRYAWIGIVTGSLGMVIWAASIFYWWYSGIDPRDWWGPAE